MTKVPDARAIALEALRILRRRDAYADSVLDGLLGRHPGLDARGRGLVSHLVYGVLRWQNQLDAHLERAARRNLSSTHPRVLDVLRLGAYQILHLDRIPDHAAVFESVELARRSGLGHAAGFVNAVLRRVSEFGPELPLPPDPPARLSLLFGCPLWLVEEWLHSFGEDGAEKLCRAASTIPTLFLRVDSRRLSRDDAVTELARSGVEAGRGTRAPDAVWVEGSGDPRALGPAARGHAVVQDQASQLVSYVLAPQPGWRILDACAGPGLKATHLAQLMNDSGEVVALDIHPHRTRMVEDLARHVGTRAVRTVVADAALWEPEGDFDAALVDAPCSGLGVLSRTPDAKWRRKPEDLAGFPGLQLALLRNASRALRRGGVLVYATCTTSRAENEEVVEAFLRENGDFRLEPPPGDPALWNGLLSPEGFFRTFPGCSGDRGAAALDGFFSARFVRGSP